MQRIRMLVAGMVLFVVLAMGTPSPAQLTGTAADFRSVAADFDPVVHAEVTHSNEVDTPALSGVSEPQPYYGVGVRGVGGYIGVEGRSLAMGYGDRYGVWGEGGHGADTNYGVYGLAYGTGTNYAVYAGGDLAYTGSLINASDLRLKKNLAASESTLDKLMDLQVVTYEHKSDPELAHMNLPKGLQIGFIAQQVAEVFPSLVVEAVHPPKKSSEEGRNEEAEPIRYQALKPIQLIPILVKAIQEQQEQIEGLKAQIGPLKNRLAQLQQNEGTTKIAAVSP